MNNTRFATALHILTLLANTTDEWLSSEWIAGSININPVIVRRELKVLQEVGLVVSRKGKEGGSKLGKAAKEITLAEIFNSVRNSELLGKKNAHPNPRCSVGKDINRNLEKLFAETEQHVAHFLSGKTLDEFAGQFRGKTG